MVHDHRAGEQDRAQLVAVDLTEVPEWPTRSAIFSIGTPVVGQQRDEAVTQLSWGPVGRAFRTPVIASAEAARTHSHDPASSRRTAPGPENQRTGGPA